MVEPKSKGQLRMKFRETKLILQASLTSYVFESECDSRDPKWAPDADILLGPDGNGNGYRLAFGLDAVENARCATDFEVKYWESGRFEQRVSRVENHDDVGDKYRVR